MERNNFLAGARARARARKINMYLLIFILVLFCPIATFCETINLICYRNGVGLNRDIDILQEELTKLGHTVHFLDSSDQTPKPKADVNVFVDVVEEFFFPFAEKNYLIPNPEWCFLSPEQLAKFDRILCKTKEAERIFKPFNPNTLHIGFTSKDHYRSEIPKQYKLPLHLVGASIQKGTDAIIKTWVQNPQFPKLLLVRHKGKSTYPPSKNIQLLHEYLPDRTLIQLQNTYGLHLCPSETEGFGHYMMEAMSCGSVVVTTDAPPMNEFIFDKRCLVPFSHSAPWRLATNYYVDQSKLETVIADLLCLPEAELKEIGRQNREFYLKNNQTFKEKLVEIFNFCPQAWERSEYIWNLGLATTCAKGIDPNPKQFFATYWQLKLNKNILNNLQPGEVIWMRCSEVSKFAKEILPEIHQPVVLLISDGDESFPSAFSNEFDIESLLSNDYISHVFAQNCDYKGPSRKVSHCPIGIDFHTTAYRGEFWGDKGSPQQQEAVLKEIVHTLKPTHLRQKRAFVDFHHAGNLRHADRTTIFNRLKTTNLIDHGNYMKRSELWKTKGQYAFSISPHGNGLDCHRTWEDLVLGCIVIVKTSPLDPLYEGLPVVIVKDWSEVPQENMDLWLKQYGDAFTNPQYREKLTNQYWLNKIKQKAEIRKQKNLLSQRETRFWPFRSNEFVFELS